MSAVKLTKRESEVADLLCAGLSANAIAETLHITPKSVCNVTQRVCEAFGIRGSKRALALKLALTRGKENGAHLLYQPLATSFTLDAVTERLRMRSRCT